MRKPRGASKRGRKRSVKIAGIERKKIELQGVRTVRNGKELCER